jgi:hypothetical protein
MFHRFSSWWRALCVVLISLATITWPHLSVAATSADLVLNHQETVATINAKGMARYAATFTLHSPGNHTMQAVLYPHLVGTSQLLGVANGVGPGTPPVTTSNTIQLSCTKDGLTQVDLVLQTSTKSVGKGPCDTLPLIIHLNCVKVSCNGVYPVHYIATTGQLHTSTWALIVVANGKILHPINVVPLLVVDRRATTSPTNLAAALRVVASFPSSPITLATNYQALENISVAPHGVRKALRNSVASLTHRVIASPSPQIDFGQLSAHGLDSQVQQQLTLTNQFLFTATGRNLDAPLYLRGVTPVASLTALARAGVQQAVVAESSLVTQPSATYTWGAPFALAQVPGISALPTFGPVNQLLASVGLNPGNRANALLALLSFLHYEAPNLPQARSVVVPINTGTTDSHFLSEFLAGLATNRILSLSQLSTVLSPALIGANGASASEDIIDRPTTPWTQNSVAYLDQLISEVSSFNQTIANPWLSLTLMGRLANAEQIASTDVLNNGLAKVGASLLHQFRLLTLDPSAITLTARHSSIPVTLLSKANYPMTVLVQLTASGLTFPKGATQLVTISSQTKSLRIPAVDLRGSSLTLRVNVFTSDGQVLLTHEVIQVRFAGASLAGYLLTFVSALVLALWWIRTIWRSRRFPQAQL